MEVWEQQLKQLQQQVQQLLRKLAQLEKEQQQMQTELEAARTQHANMRHELEVTQLQQAILKASQQPLNGEEKKEMERRLQQYIGHIEQCIALLSR